VSDEKHFIAWGVRGGRLMFTLTAIGPGARTMTDMTETIIDPQIGEPYASRMRDALNRQMRPEPKPHPVDCATCRASRAT
jgi:hypothetical protein